MTLIAVALALVLVVVLRGGSGGPAAGSPEAVTDRLATALQDHARGQIAATACPGAAADVVRQARGVLVGVRTAARRGPADVHGTVGVARLALGLAGSPVAATVALQRPRGADWCVAAFAVGRPAR